MKFLAHISIPFVECEKAVSIEQEWPNTALTHVMREHANYASDTILRKHERLCHSSLIFLGSHTRFSQSRTDEWIAN